MLSLMAYFTILSYFNKISTKFWGVLGLGFFWLIYLKLHVNFLHQDSYRNALKAIYNTTEQPLRSKPWEHSSVKVLISLFVSAVPQLHNCQHCVACSCSEDWNLLQVLACFSFLAWVQVICSYIKKKPPIPLWHGTLIWKFIKGSLDN